MPKPFPSTYFNFSLFLRYYSPLSLALDTLSGISTYHFLQNEVSLISNPSLEGQALILAYAPLGRFVSV
jgi:hypothetical protein